MKNQDRENYIGVDVSKATLDCCVLPSKETRQFPNTDEGYKQFIAWAKQIKPQLVLCEHTGGLEKQFVIAVADAGLPVRAKNPLHIRMFARSFGTNAKTDKNDARIIAQFAMERKPDATQPIDKQQLAMQELITARRQLVKVRVQLQNQLELATQKIVVKSHLKLIENINKQIEKIETEMETILASNDEWKHRKEILKSVPGIGDETARTLLIECPELGSGDADKSSALVGVVPMNWDSGKMHGRSHIFGGRITVRCALYNAAVASVFFCKKADNVFKQMY